MLLLHGEEYRKKREGTRTSEKCWNGRIKNLRMAGRASSPIGRLLHRLEYFGGFLPRVTAYSRNFFSGFSCFCAIFAMELHNVAAVWVFRTPLWAGGSRTGSIKRDRVVITFLVTQLSSSFRSWCLLTPQSSLSIFTTLQNTAVGRRIR